MAKEERRNGDRDHWGKLQREIHPGLGALKKDQGGDHNRQGLSAVGEATALFREKLSRAVNGDSILYVISDPELLSLLPDGAKRIYVKADLETIKERFRARMHGKLPPPVEAMLERRHGLFDGEQFDMIYDGANDSPEAFCSRHFPDGPNYGG